MSESESKLTIYRSSAGSGKTFTLVTEYLKLVMADPNAFRRILAITFTNKATEEMKTRIIGQLVKIAGGGESEYVREHLGLPYGEEESQDRAEQALSNILHDYSGFAISTIDSFFSTMVRNLARELNLPMRFEMELGQDNVIRQITFDLFEDIEKDDELREWLQEYLMDMLDNDKGWKIEPRIHGTAKQLFTDAFRDTHEGGKAIPDRVLIGKFKKIKSDMENAMVGYGKQFQEVFDTNGLEIKDFSGGNRGPASYASKLLKARSKFPEFNATFIKAATEPSAWYSKKGEKSAMIKEIAENRLTSIASSVLQYYEANASDYHGATEVLKVIYLSGLLGRLNNKLMDYRDATDTILLSDVNYMLRKAIGPQDAPFIYEKAGNRFRHFMLDEFQDTSTTQWLNLLPLLINSLSTGYSSLIVGDAKQSIYRWRGGDMQLLQKRINTDLDAFKSMTDSKFLGNNWRSREVVVSFNNAFFPSSAKLLAGKLDESTAALLTGVYEEKYVHQTYKKGKPGDGTVDIRFYEKKESKGEEDEEESGAQGWKFRSMEDTCKKIKALENSGYRLGEMVILCRTNDDALFITSHLLSKGITNVISPESLLLEGSPDIRFLISLMKFLVTPSDPITLAHICYYYDKGKTPVHELLTGKRQDLISRLPKEYISRAHELRSITLYETVEELCRIFNLMKEPDAYLQRFHDLAQEYVNSNPPGIGDFLNWWDENRDSDSCSVILPPGKDAIRVMSIHKSKGLEFRIVFIPLCNWDFTPKHYGLIWAKSDREPFNELEAHLLHPVKELSKSVFSADYEAEYGMHAIDNLNMLYVAFTRAEEQLYIHCTTPPKERKEESQFNASTLLYDTLTAVPLFAEKLTESGGVSLTIGEEPEHITKTETDEHRPELKEWISIPWKDKLWLGVNKRKISVSDPEMPDTRYGNLFHDTMSRITAVEDIQEVRSTVLDLNKDIEPEMQSRLFEEIDFVLNEGLNRHWFSKESKAFIERDILSEGGKLLRPDRVVITAENLIQVIDYKTGTEEEWHGDQVRKYGEMLVKMGYSKPELYVVYPALRKVAVIDF